MSSTRNETRIDQQTTTTTLQNARTTLGNVKKISYESVHARLENTDVVKLDTEELKNFNKNGITLVTPDENTFFTYNYNPDFGWDSGCQLVFLNYQNVFLVNYK